MIADAINSALADAWAKVVGLFTLSFIDPFWHWVPWAIVVVVAVWLIVKFFGDWIPQLKPLGGGIIITIGLMLYALWKGEQEARDFDKKRRRK